jgi:hypothetical protein
MARTDQLPAVCEGRTIVQTPAALKADRGVRAVRFTGFRRFPCHEAAASADANACAG